MELLAVIIQPRRETVNSVYSVDCFTVFTPREGVKGLVAVVLYDRTVLILRARQQGHTSVQQRLRSLAATDCKTAERVENICFSEM